MNNKFIILDCDDDVVLFEKDTFKVSRLKELLNNQIQYKLDRQFFRTYYKGINSEPDGKVIDLLSKISLNSENIEIDEIQYNSLKDCQLLKIGGKEWQKGKLKIKICIYPEDQESDEVHLEFCSDELIETESPLDDLRKMIQAT